MVGIVQRYAEHRDVALAALAVTALTVGATIVAGRRAGRSARWLATALAAGWLVVIALATLLRPAVGGQAVNLRPGFGGDAHGLAGFAANAALFVPFGGLAWLSFARRRLAAVTLLAIAVPVAIEALQYYLALGRISDVNDVIANAVGTAAGATLVAIASRVARRRRAAPSPA